MKSNGIRLTVAIAMLAGVCAANMPAGAAHEPPIQIAVLLDTSSSMDGLIAQAKSELWNIVNTFATAKREGKPPELQVALYEYGNNTLPAKIAHLRKLVPLTTDLDAVSEKLSVLSASRIPGANEYCGAVIEAATEGLDWSESNDDLKIVFIAGNEAFTQGSVDYRKACQAAIEKGIIVNTIFCGSYEGGVGTKWKDGALLADGMYMNIDQNRAIAHIEAPQDTAIVRLGVELNGTYIPYGVRGDAGKKRQERQEAFALSASPSTYMERQVTKSSNLYRSADWDLVEGVRESKVNLKDLKDTDLPGRMQKMSLEERKAFVESQTKRRAQIQAKIKKLNQEREKHIADQKHRAGKSGARTLDEAMIEAIRKQAKRKNYKLK